MFLDISTASYHFLRSHRLQIITLQTSSLHTSHHHHIHPSLPSHLPIFHIPNTTRYPSVTGCQHCRTCLPPCRTSCHSASISRDGRGTLRTAGGPRYRERPSPASPPPPPGERRGSRRLKNCIKAAVSSSLRCLSI